MIAVRRYWRGIGLTVLLSLMLLVRCAEPAYALDPPLLLIVEQDTVLYSPDGQRVAISAGTELDVCADELGMLLHYELEPVVVRVPAPCHERPLFADGFEEPGR